MFMCYAFVDLTYMRFDVILTNSNKNMTPEKLEELTGLRIKALAPGKSDNAWAYAGVALCVAEAGAAQYYGVDPLQVHPF